MTNKLLGASLVGLLALVVTQPQDAPTDQDLLQVRQAIADLGLRVSRLEHAGGVTPGPLQGDGGEVTARSMVVAGIQTADNPPPNQDEIDQLQDDIDALQKTVNFHENQRDRVSGDTYYASGYYADDHYGYNHSINGRNRQEVAQDHMADRYATQLGIKTRKLNELKAAASQPHQVIHGHDGNVIFTLRTTVDLAKALKDINIGDTVTWRGQRSSADESAEVWLISSIEKIERQ